MLADLEKQLTEQLIITERRLEAVEELISQDNAKQDVKPI